MVNIVASLWIGVLLLVTFLGASPEAGQRGQYTSNETIKVPFVDEAEKDPEFAAFRAGLLAALKRRDPVIQSSLESDTWERLIEAIQLGGRFRVSYGHREFCAPYTACLEKSPRYDPLVSKNALYSELYEAPIGIVAGYRMPVYRSRSLTSEVIGHLTYEVVPALFEQEWVRILLPDANWTGGIYPRRFGYMRRGAIRETDERPVRFEHRDGRWHLRSY